LISTKNKKGRMSEIRPSVVTRSCSWNYTKKVCFLGLQHVFGLKELAIRVQSTAIILPVQDSGKVFVETTRDFGYVHGIICKGRASSTTFFLPISQQKRCFSRGIGSFADAFCCFIAF